MTDTERQTLVDCLEHLREELRSGQDPTHQLPVIASWLSLILEYCLRFYCRQFKLQSTGEHGLLHRLEMVLNNYYICQDDIVDIDLDLSVILQAKKMWYSV